MSALPGEDAVLDLAQDACAGRAGRRGSQRVLSEGQGLPGIPHHYVIPYFPETQGGRFVTYKLLDHDWVTPHTHRFVDPTTVSVAICGPIRSRWSPQPKARDPGTGQFLALVELVEHLVGSLGLDVSAVCPRSEFGSPSSPGDVIEAWVQHLHGLEPTWLDPARRLWDPLRPSHERELPAPSWSQPLRGWDERHAALWSLGYQPPADGAPPDASTTMAIRAFQRHRGLVVDGQWGPATEFAVQHAMDPNR